MHEFKYTNVVSEDIGDGVHLIHYEPGNCTKYVIIATHGGSIRSSLGAPVIVSLVVPYGNCYPFHPSDDFYPGYVAEKLTNDNIADADIVAAVMAHIFRTNSSFS